MQLVVLMLAPFMLPFGLCLTGHGSQISRVRASYAGGREFSSQSSQTNDISNFDLSLPSLALGINKMGQGLVHSV